MSYNTFYAGGIDYHEVSSTLPINFGTERTCTGISIITDKKIEEDETFRVTIAELGIYATITILDDGMELQIKFDGLLHACCI